MKYREMYMVTGAAGFIGSNLTRFLVSRGHRVIAFDKLTYAGNYSSISDLPDNSVIFIQKDICDTAAVYAALTDYKVDGIFHLAAESHVDRSIDGPCEFIRTNIVGTFSMLTAAMKYYANLDAQQKEGFRFLHVSTDEVYGSLGEEGYFTEETPYAPNSPYSASKASSDHLVRAWFRTYGLPVLTTNCSNNYGPRQFPEKLIPLIIHKALNGESLPIYGDGKNIRDWLYVDDHCSALYTVMKKGIPGETYNVGGNSEKQNIEIVRCICSILDELRPKGDGSQYEEQITFVPDRPGHDRRYAIDASKLNHKLGWEPEESFSSGMRKTVEWYLNNPEWVDDIIKGKYQLQRLGHTTV